MANLTPDPAEELRQQVYDFTRQAGAGAQPEPMPEDILTINIGGEQAPPTAAQREAAIPQFSELPSPETEYAPRQEVKPAVDYNPNFYTITQEDISSSRNMRLLGAQAGDQINPETKKLIRRFSRDEDRVEDYFYIDEALAKREPEEMKRLGAEIGDVIVDGKLIKTGNSSFLKQMSYAFDTTESFYELANKYGTVLGVYNQESVKGYPDAESRRKALNRETERELKKEYGRWFKPDEGVTAANVLGTLGAAAVDPVTYVPGVGVGVAKLGMKSLMAGESAVAGGYSMLQDLVSDKGEIDPAKAALFSTVGAASIAVPAVAGKVIKNVRDKKADTFVNEVEDYVSQHIAAGGSQKGAFDAAAEEFGAKKITAALNRTGRTLNIPSDPDVAARNLNKLIAEDPLGAASSYSNVAKAFASTRTEIMNRAPTLAKRIDTYDHMIGFESAAYIERIKPSLERLMKLPQANRINRHLMNEDLESALKTTPKQFHADVRNILDVYKEVGKRLIKEGGKKFDMKGVYVHRYMKNYDKLLKAMGVEKKSNIDRAVRDYATKKNIDVKDVPDEIRYKLADQVIRGIKPDAASTGLPQTKQRVLNITDDIMPYYGNMAEALEHYVRTSMTAIQKAKLLGYGTKKNYTQFDEDGVLNVSESLGRMLADLEKDGIVKGADVTDLTKMFNARLGSGEKAMHGFWGFMSKLGYAGTIANPFSAFVQMSDFAASGAVNGFRNTIASFLSIPVSKLTKAVTGKDTQLIKLIDTGIQEAAAEMADMTRSAKLLHNMFKLSGFSALDALGKETIANAALRKNLKRMMTPKGEASFRKEFGKYYGDEIDDVVDAHKALAARKVEGKLTPQDVPDLVRFHSLAEILDLQPATRSDMPYGWLSSPNARPLYMLKTWTLKQYDILRRKIFQEWKSGNKVQAVKFATTYLSTMAVATGSTSMAVNALLGREVKPEDFTEEAINGLLSMYGFSKYSQDKYLLRGDVTGFLKNTVTPATPIFDSAGKFAGDVIKDDVKEPAAYVKPFPVVGRAIESWFGGGAERYNERRD